MIKKIELSFVRVIASHLVAHIASVFGDLLPSSSLGMNYSEILIDAPTFQFKTKYRVP